MAAIRSNFLGICGLQHGSVTVFTTLRMTLLMLFVEPAESMHFLATAERAPNTDQGFWWD